MRRHVFAVGAVAALVITDIVIRVRRHRRERDASIVTTSVPDAVRLRLVEAVSGDSEKRLFELAYTDGDGTTRFGFALCGSPSAPDAESGFAIDSALFLSREGSRPEPLLRALARIHGSDVVPAPASRSLESLAVDVALLGNRMNRGPDGWDGTAASSAMKNGQWLNLKLFFPANSSDEDDCGEIYFNLNPTAGTAEFELKDPEYWEVLGPMLAQVF
jgi:hypothetical protein